MGHTRDIIAIGASAGGVQALQDLVSGLPPDLPAAVLVALHTAPGHPSQLPEILTRRGPLRATHGVHGEEIVRGRIYVAPPRSEAGGFEQFRCRVGHTFSLESLAVEQADAVERALWAAARALDESAAILRRAGASATGGEHQRRLAEREAAQLHDARLIREILLHGKVLSPADPVGAPAAGS